MKKLVSRMLALAICLSLLMTSALAAQPLVLPVEEKSDYLYIKSIAAAGDELYLLTSERSQLKLWRWKADMAQAELVTDALICAEIYNTQSVMEAEVAELGKAGDPRYAVSCIFSDGETLYGFNHLNGLVYTIEAEGQAVSCRDVVVLTNPEATQDMSSASGGFIAPVSVVRAGDWMLWYAIDRNTRNYDERILAFNLKTGVVKQAVLPRQYAVCSYKDGKALVICQATAAQQEEGSYAVYAYDPHTDAAECLGLLPKGLVLRHADYSSELDMLVYQDQTRIMGWSAENGPEQLGFVSSPAYVSLTVLGDQVIYHTNSVEDITATAIQKGFSTEHSLTLLGGTVYEAYKQFALSHEDVPVYYISDDDGEGYEALLSRTEDAPDMIRINASDYAALVEGGYLLDLSGNEKIRQYADVLYPAYRSLVMKEGGVYGVPVYANSYNGWYINKEVMTAMGLTAEDIPTSLTELCAFATRWNEEYAEKYPHFTLLNNTEEYRERIFHEMVRLWTAYCQYNGRELSFDDPIFRELLSALDAARLDKLNAALRQTNPEVSEYKQALIWTGCKDVGNWATYMEEYSDRVFIPLTLTPETPYIASVDNVRLWAVNAKSEKAEYAAALLAEIIAQLDPVHAYVLRSDKTEPVVSPNYEEQFNYYQERLKQLESRLDESVNRATIEKRIEELKTSMAQASYSVNPSAIEQYVSVIAPASYVKMPDPVTSAERSEQLNGCMNQYISGAMAADELITLLDKLLKSEQ